MTSDPEQATERLSPTAERPASPVPVYVVGPGAYATLPEAVEAVRATAVYRMGRHPALLGLTARVAEEGEAGAAVEVLDAAGAVVGRVDVPRMFLCEPPAGVKP